MSEETQTVDMAGEDALFLDIGDMIEVEDAQMGAVHPIVQWVNGDPKQKRAGGIGFTGGFFVAAEQGVIPPGFVPYTLMTRDAQEVPGYASQNVTGTPVRFRRSWLARPDEKGLARRYPWGGYENAKKADFQQRPRGRGQLLFIIDGMDEPVVLTFSGMAAASVFSQGRDRGIIPTFNQNVVQQASRMAHKAGAKKAYPLCAFKLTIGPDMKDAETPNFIEVGKGEQKSTVTSPSWIGHVASIDEKTVASWMNGANREERRARFDIAQGVHKDANDWADAWSASMLVKALKRALESKSDLDSLTTDDEEETSAGEKEVPF